jgi:hypothetical protein
MLNVLGASFGTATLLQHLEGVLTSIRMLAGNPPLDSKTTEFVKQIEELVAITSSLDDTTTSSRRQPYHTGAWAEGDIILLQRLTRCMTTVVQEFTEFAGILQSAVGDLSKEKISNPFSPEKAALSNQDWFEEWLQTTRLQTEALQALLSAFNLIYQKNDLDDEGHMPVEAQSLASTLNYRLALLREELKTVGRQHKEWVNSVLSFPHQFLLIQA